MKTIFQEESAPCICSTSVYCAASQRDQESGFPYLFDLEYEPQPFFEPGKCINGRYKVKEILSGSMGDVYHCYDPTLRADVSLKTLAKTRKNSRIGVNSFYKEIQARLGLDSHPNVVYLMLVENIDGYPYIISEWVEGSPVYGNTLAQWIESYPFCLDQVLDVMLQLCNGLDHCFRQLSSSEEPFVLGDLKPENVLVDKNHVLKLMDFSSHVYTPGWESPEQIRGEKLDARSDLYTLGLIADRIWHSLDNEAQSSALGREIKNLIDNCLEFDREKRVPDYDTLRKYITDIGRRFQCRHTVCEKPKRGFLDTLCRIESALNMGWEAKVYSNILNTCMAINKGFINMNEYMQYTRDSDVVMYEAIAAIQKEHYEEALKQIAQYRLRHDSIPSKFFYVRGQIFLLMKKYWEAFQDFREASKKELHLLSLNAAADLLISVPGWMRNQEISTWVQKTLECLQKELPRISTGYLANQVQGKLCMMLEEYGMASRSFRESLHYPNLEEWRNLYYFGICEYRQKHFFKARVLFETTANVLQEDYACIENMDKMHALLQCWYTLGARDQTQHVADDIFSRYGINLHDWCNKLDCDLKTTEDYLKHLAVLEQAPGCTTGDRIASLHSIWQKAMTEKNFLDPMRKYEVVLTLGTHEIYWLFEDKRYVEAIEVCEKLQQYDEENPIISENMGACFYKMGQMDLAGIHYSNAAEWTADAKEKQRIQSIWEEICLCCEKAMER